MLLNNSREINELVLRSLLERECQFFIYYVDNTVVRVAFKQGIWRVMRHDWAPPEEIPDVDQYFDLSDNLEIVDCFNSLLRGVLEAKVEISKKRKWSPVSYRREPAWIIAGAIDLWAGRHENITEIKVTQFGRDGWFNNFDDK